MMIVSDLLGCALCQLAPLFERLLAWSCAYYEWAGFQQVLELLEKLGTERNPLHQCSRQQVWVGSLEFA